MKICPKTGVRYDHTPTEWAEHLRRMGGAGMSLPASIAARIKPPEPPQEQDPAAQGCGSVADIRPG
jgi:hypothetical protein